MSDAIDSWITTAQVDPGQVCLLKRIGDIKLLMSVDDAITFADKAREERLVEFKQAADIWQSKRGRH